MLRAAQQVARLGDARVVQKVEGAGSDDRVEQPPEMRRAEAADVRQVIHVKLLGIMVFDVVEDGGEHHRVFRRAACERGFQPALALDAVELDAQRQQKTHGARLVLRVLFPDLAYDHRGEIIDIRIFIAAQDVPVFLVSAQGQVKSADLGRHVLEQFLRVQEQV